MKTCKYVSLNEAAVKKINDWRRRQEVIPSFSNALETLILLGLDCEVVNGEDAEETEG